MSNDISKQVLVKMGQKADAFCVHFTTLGAETFGRAERSAIASGYGEKSARNQGTKLLKRLGVQKRIAELHAANMARNFLTSDKVLNDLESVRLQAVEKGDLSAAIRASELQGKYLAMFVDRQSFETPEHQQQLDESERRINQRIAAVCLGMTLDESYVAQDSGQGDGQPVGGIIEGEKTPDETPYHPQPPTPVDSIPPAPASK